MAPKGHAHIHLPQLIHKLWSIFALPLPSFFIAFTGHASSHGTTSFKIALYGQASFHFPQFLHLSVSICAL